MIRTITEAEAPSLTIRGDVPDIRAGFTGPVEMLGLHMSRLDLWVLTAYGAGGMANGAEPARLRFPVARPEVQAHLVEWLGRGERCDGCDSFGAPDLHEEPCTGWIRPPADLYHLLKPHTLGGFPDWIRMALLWGSVVRVAAGIRPPRPDAYTPRSQGARVGYLGEVLTDRWAVLHVDDPRTPETCDAHWLSLGIALIDDTPNGRVIRFEVPDDTP